MGVPRCWPPSSSTPGRPGRDRIRLDTRADLVEARALYARHGYVEIPAYSHGPYAEHWFEKRPG